MAHRDSQDHRRWPRPSMTWPRTLLIAAVIGCLLSVGTPLALWGASGFTVDGQRVARPTDDPAGLGITGALPGDPSPGDALPGDALPGDALADGPLGIPGSMLDAYERAVRTLGATQPGCRLSWAVLAGIGRIESGHASDGRVDATGNTLGPILGAQLDGSPGIAAIADTDDGALDQDLVWDRAVGPMQFIPSSWRGFGVDGNGDGVANPHNIYDATLAAGRYLCAGGADLSDPPQLLGAVFRYNRSASYVTIVLRWAVAYLTGVVPTSPAPGPVPPGTNGNGGLPVAIDGTSLGADVPAVLVRTAPLIPPPPEAPAGPTPPTPTETAPTSSLPSPAPTPEPPAPSTPPPPPVTTTPLPTDPTADPPTTASPATTPSPSPSPAGGATTPPEP